MNKPEILAPAGSYEAFLAAVHNGCDAVYLGGKAYGARAYADNFDMETLTRAVDYAYAFGVKIYYTINTLFKEKELPGLVEHLGDVLNTGVDALIVQDLGVLKVIRDYYPDAEIHVSTQMNCHSPQGVAFLETLGVQRVVLARELNLNEIKEISDGTSMEIEAFVHGALCYCYSGQCLMSSFLGGRSGNRGRCAQPCRLTYKGVIEDKAYETAHVLSPKDIETLSVLPEIIEAGVNSLKIEGRMKSPEYVGMMTYLYRKYRDLYLETGSYTITAKDMEDMLQIFNRGGFSTGYYKQHNGRDMITLTQPKNQGVAAGYCLEQKGNQVKIKTDLNLLAGDCIEFLMNDGSYDSIILQEGIKGSGRVKVEGRVAEASPFRRIKSMALSDKIGIMNNEPSMKTLDMKVTLKVGEPSCLEIFDGKKSVLVYGDQVQQAQKQGLTETKVEKQMLKTGTLPVEIGEVSILMPKDAFMAVSQLNALRRAGFDAYFGKSTPDEIVKKEYAPLGNKPKASHQRNITVLSNNRYQIDTVLAYDVSRLYLEWVNYTSDDIKKVLTHEKVTSGQVEVWLAVPRIMRREKALQIKGLLDTYDDRIQGFLVRSMDGYGYIRAYGKAIRWDYSMNLMNREAVRVLMSLDGSKGYMPSLELKYGELKGLDLSYGEILIYGHIKSMVSAQCVRKTLEGCCYEQGYFFSMVDRKGMDVPVETNCLLCYNILYNGTPLYLADKTEAFNALGAGDFRLDFAIEDEVTIRRIMEAVTGEGSRDPNHFLNSFTRGHYNKGVE